MKRKLFYLFNSMLVFNASWLTVSCVTNDTIHYSDAEFYVLSVGNANFTYLLEEGGVATVFDAGYGTQSDEETSAKYDNTKLDARANSWYWETDASKAQWAIDFMKSSGVERIESIFISHKHSDHYSMVQQLTQAFPVNTVYGPYNSIGLAAELPQAENVVTEQWIKEYTSNGRKYTNVTSYASQATRNSITLSSDPNDTSYVLKFNLNGKNIMLGGDMTDAIFPNDTNFLNKATETSIDVLLAAHHGSGNSFTKVYKALASKGYELEHLLVSGTSNLRLDQSETSTEPDWTEFSGGHKFPDSSTLSAIKNNFALYNHPMHEASIHITGSGGSLSTNVYNVPEFDSNNFNHSFKYVSNAANDYVGEVVPIADNVTNYNQISSFTAHVQTAQHHDFDWNLYTFNLSQSIIEKYESENK